MTNKQIEKEFQEELKEAQAPVVLRDEHGRILPGQSLNPGGRPRDMRTAQAKLHKALKRVEKQTGKKFLEHYIKQAFKDRTMAIALLKKLVPDLKAVEIDQEGKEVWQVLLTSFAKRDNDKAKEKAK